MLSFLAFLLAIAAIPKCYANDCIYGEGVICRNYFKAVSCGKLDVCEDLWMHAHIIDEKVLFGDCQICEHFIKSGNHDAILKIVKHKSNMSDLTVTSLYSLHSKLKSSKLLCTLLQKCSDSGLTLPTLRFNSNETCENCKKIISDVKVLIKGNGTRLAVSTYLKAAICIHLPLQIVDICKKSVDNYVGLIIDLILGEVDQDGICTLFGLCEHGAEEKNRSMNMSISGSSNKYSWIKRPSQKGFENWHSRLTIETDSQCEECLTVLSRIRNDTKNAVFVNSIQVKIQETMCGSSGFLKNMCKATISQRVSELIDHASSMNLLDLCTFFNQCQNRTSDTMMNIFSNFPPKKNYNYKQQGDASEGGIPVVCEFCEVIMHKILQKTVNNRTKEAIIYALEEFCSVFPTEKKHECFKVIEDYGSIIVEAIVSGTAPKVFCDMIGLCGPVPDSDIFSVSLNSVSTDTIDENRDSDTCSVCELIVGFVYDKLEKNATMEEIVEHLTTVCSYIPYYKTQCEDLVNAYAADLVKLFIEGAPPTKVCQLLRMCPEEKRDDVCRICQVVVDYIYSRIEENSTIESITEVLEEACTHIPYWKSQCKNIVDKYSSILVKLLAQSVPSIEVCQYMNLCASKIHIERLCSGGPVVWCRDSSTALLCSKTDLCRAIYGLAESTRQPVSPSNIDCSRFLNTKQRCENRSIAAYCGFSSGCKEYWVTGREMNPLYSDCSFCRRVLNKKLTYGTSAVDCSLYMSLNRQKCEVIKSASFPERPTFEKLNELCSSLGMCGTKNIEDESTNCIPTLNEQPLLGSNICTWGPSVFCRDLKSATLCNSIPYCQRHVWRSSKPKTVSVLSSETVQGYPLIDCSMPLDKLCKSSFLKHCALSVVKQCDDFRDSQTKQFGYQTSKSEEELKMRICANPATSVCGDEQRVALCGFQAYCEAMGVPVIRKKTTVSPKENHIGCNHGNAVVCQSYQNAVRCDAVERCRAEVWMR